MRSWSPSKLRIHFAPGSRYAYSGEGNILLQVVLERGLGLDVGEEMQRRVFDRFGINNTSMIWRLPRTSPTAGTPMAGRAARRTQHGARGPAR